MDSGFGPNCSISATILREDTPPYLPVRLVAIHLDGRPERRVAVSGTSSDKLMDELRRLNEKYLTHNPNSGGIVYQRIARIYDSGTIGRKQVPTVYIVKPDQIRYWTRSAALRDADEVFAEIQMWQAASGRSGSSS